MPPQLNARVLLIALRLRNTGTLWFSNALISCLNTAFFVSVP